MNGLAHLARGILAIGIFACLTSQLGTAEQRLVLSLRDQQELVLLSVDDSGRIKIDGRTSVAGLPAAMCSDSTGSNLYVTSAEPAMISVHRNGPMD